ncbi:MAG: hypothetical protein V3S55_12010, partial [Nitrospiraceae bacterium]
MQSIKAKLRACGQHFLEASVPAPPEKLSRRSDSPNSGIPNRPGFMRSYIPPVCRPSRAMLLSGKSLFRAPRQLDRGALLPEVFRKAGYTTFATGKWHNGRESWLR